jgi:hypothetical protein
MSTINHERGLAGALPERFPANLAHRAFFEWGASVARRIKEASR